MASRKQWNDDLGLPHLPESPSVSVDGLSLAAARDSMTAMPRDARIERAILSLVEQWLKDSTSVAPLHSVRTLMDSIRTLPRGDERAHQMNTLVRTLGQPEVLATFLDMLRDSSQCTGTREEELSRVSRNATQHSIYGWRGQTALMTSSEEPTKGMVAPEPGVAEMLGEAPTAVWGLSLHIWQPNRRARGFQSGKRVEPGIVLEPPHSHPFDFVSMLAIGSMHHSTYAQRASGNGSLQMDAVIRGGRYDGTVLEHVYGVWPPHDQRSACEIVTLEEHVPMTAGDSYYMTCDRIHDVEVDATLANDRPAITLFLASEVVVKPHVYMAPSMLAYHDAHPDLKRSGRALPADAWHAKLEAVAAYLRGKSATLRLDEIVKHDLEYAFFHV